MPSVVPGVRRKSTTLVSHTNLLHIGLKFQTWNKRRTGASQQSLVGNVNKRERRLPLFPLPSASQEPTHFSARSYSWMLRSCSKFGNLVEMCCCDGYRNVVGTSRVGSRGHCIVAQRIRRVAHELFTEIIKLWGWRRPLDADVSISRVIASRLIPGAAPSARGCSISRYQAASDA